MSRSYYKVPIFNNGGNTWFKSHANRTLRRRVVAAINSELEIMPLIREVSNIWSSKRDGNPPHFSHSPVYQRHWSNWRDDATGCWCSEGKNVWQMRRK